jgi:hypothetical protein
MTDDATPREVGSHAGLGLAPERDAVLAQLDDRTNQTWNSKRKRWAALVRAQDAEIQNLRLALKWYADGEHFTKADPDAWDTVSGEPANWWNDEAGTAMVEDGTLAGMVLAGQLTGQKLHALDDGEEA